MKVLILCALFAAAHSAGIPHAVVSHGAVLGGPPVVVPAPVLAAPAVKVVEAAPLAHVEPLVVIPAAPAVVEEGVSTQVRNQDSLGNYNFAYQEDHTSGGSFRKEAGDALGNVAGSYGLHVADGRVRVVNYIANDDGFRADIKTNEPGVVPEDPADTTINKEPGVVLAAAAAPAVAPVAVAAPIPVAVAAPAPVAAPVPIPLAAPAPVHLAAPAPVHLAAPAPVPLAAHFPAAPLPVEHETIVKGADAITAVRAHEGTLPVFPAAPVVPVVKSHVEEVKFPEAQEVVVKSQGAAVVPSAPIVTKTSGLFPYPAAVAAKSIHGVHPLNAYSASHVIAGHPYGAYGYGYGYAAHA